MMSYTVAPLSGREAPKALKLACVNEIKRIGKLVKNELLWRRTLSFSLILSYYI